MNQKDEIEKNYNDLLLKKADQEKRVKDEEDNKK